MRISDWSSDVCSSDLLSYIYVLLGHAPLIVGLFFGLKAAVLAVVIEAVVRIGKRALKNNVMRGMAVAAFVAIFFLDAPFPLIVLTAALAGFLGGRAGLPIGRASCRERVGQYV